MTNINDLYSHFNELIKLYINNILLDMIAYGNNQSVTVEDILTLTVTATFEEDENNGEITICDNDAYGFPIIATDNECDVDWGDGSPIQHYTNLNGDYFYMHHDYSEAGTYTITITGEILSIGSLLSYAETIVIPSGVTDLPTTGTNRLHEITFINPVPPTAQTGWGGSVNDVYNNLIIRVPSGSLSAYQNAQNYPTENVAYVEY